MAKTVIFAVAGSGKTTYILNQLSLERRALILTYTVKNLENLRNGVIRKYGYMPSNIVVSSYFTFLYNYCYKPVLSYRLGASGINWNPNPATYAKMTEKRYFVDRGNRLYSNRIAKLLKHHEVESLVLERLKKYFDVIYVDEVQDFGGHDFNFLKTIASAPIDLLFVGDFNQHTYDTSHDGNINSNLHNEYSKYQKQFQAMGLTIDLKTLIKSHRCNAEICAFIRERMGIHIESNRIGESKIYEVEHTEHAERLFHDSNVVKLFYDERHKYPCYGSNWGECKGEDHYEDVCLVMNPGTWNKYRKNLLSGLASRTKNKLYVACSRTKGNLYLVSESMFAAHKMR